ncbi:MAG: RNA polymerase factor sigma-54 [Phycisphaerales bacterium]
MRMSQSMKLAPRMIQSMEILQMPLLQLEERIAQELESNATLELEEPGAGDGALAASDGFAASQAAAPALQGERERPMEVDESSARDDFERLDAFESALPDAAENTFDEPPVPLADSPRMEDFSDFRSSAGPDGADAKSEAMANTAARGASLQEQLLEQWAVVDVPEPVRTLGRVIIAYIDDDGYLRTPLTTIADQPSPDASEPHPAVADLERALVALQLLLEPAGVAARDLKECLLLQIDAIEAGDAGEIGRIALTNGAAAHGPDWKVVRRLIEDHLDDLAQNRLPRIVEKTGLSMGAVKNAVEHMGILSIAPARRLVSDSTPAIIPDAVIEYDADRDRYVTYLNDRRLPNLRVNQEYASLSRDRTAPKQTREFLKKNLSNASWLIDAVELRKRTLIRVIEAIIAAQRDYFDYGPQSLRPLPMTQVAEQLGIHVATVSRAVADKYVLTPRGVVPLRGFFTGGTQTDTGEDVSWDAVKAALKEVIDAEDKSNPLSDDALAEEVKKRGVDIARRTVAKYRAQLDIPSARLRKVF